jgi:hypothetical protein
MSENSNPKPTAIEEVEQELAAALRGAAYIFEKKVVAFRVQFWPAQ